MFPTLLRALGIEAPEDLAGEDLLAPGDEGRAIFSETSRQAELRAVVRGPHKLVRDLRAGTQRLYDRSADPGEQRDVADVHPETAATLGALLDDWQLRHAPAETPPLVLDDAERERLRQLGYAVDDATVDAGASEATSAPRLVAAPPRIFADRPPVPGVQAFDVVATDVDLDGDTDVLVNWHHVGPLELLENAGGVLRHPEGVPGAGLHANLYAMRDAMKRRIRQQEGEGLHVWHDVSRLGRWRFLWRDPNARLAGLALDVDTSLEILAAEGLAEGEYERLDARSARIRLGADVRERAFSLHTRRVAVRLGLSRRPARPGAPLPPLRVGPALEPAPGGDLALWKWDPHGVAWLDLEGTPHPELFVSRGALGGELVPPLEPKRNRYFVHEGQGAPYRAVPEATTGDFGRDRRVEAVDVDNDGRLELWIGATASANRLLARDAAGAGFRDRAAELGLATRGGAVGAWADHDGDGWQDLYLIEDGALDVLRNIAGERFERIPGASIGLVLPDVEPARGLFDPARLRFADLDRDGDLDLWLLGYGAAAVHHVFRREGEGFVDVSVGLGLGPFAGGRAVLVVDLDRDGLPDLVRLGRRSQIGHNREGARLESIPLPAGTAPRRLHGATVLDVDGDDALDVLTAGQGLRLLWNRTETENGALAVRIAADPGEAIGALVTAHYADGSRAVQRYGSEHSTPTPRRSSRCASACRRARRSRRSRCAGRERTRPCATRSRDGTRSCSSAEAYSA